MAFAPTAAESWCVDLGGHSTHLQDILSQLSGSSTQPDVLSKSDHVLQALQPNEPKAHGEKSRFKHKYAIGLDRVSFRRNSNTLTKLSRNQSELTLIFRYGCH